MYIKTDDFRAIGGYDERFDGYGYEDTNLYERLKKKGFIHRLIDINILSVYHNPHNDEKRIEHYVEKDIMKSLQNNLDKHIKGIADEI